MKFFIPKKAKISNFELNNWYIPQKKAESMYNKDSTRKSNISYKKIRIFSIFFIFHLRLEDPWKFLTSNFLKFPKTNCKNSFSGTSQVLNGTKSWVLVRLPFSLWTRQMGLRLGGMIWHPPRWNRVNTYIGCFNLQLKFYLCIFLDPSFRAQFKATFWRLNLIGICYCNFPKIHED